MPKPRAKQMTAAEEAIISKGGEPGTAATVAATIEPITMVQPVQPAAAPTSSAKGVYRPTMTRFTPEDFAIVEQAVRDFARTRKMKISLNSWIVSACLEKAERDR